MLLAPNCIPAVPVWTFATSLPEELSCTPALLNALVHNKPDNHHWALIRKSTNYWSLTDTTGLHLSSFNSPAGCIGLGNWKDNSNQSQTLQLEYHHTNGHHLFPSKQPLHRAGRTTASVHMIRALWKKRFFRPLSFYLSLLFLGRGKIHLCSAVLRKYIRPLKYQVEMLTEKWIMPRKQ